MAGNAMGDTSTVAATFGWALLFSSLSAMLGPGLGMIVRHGTGASGRILIRGVVVENLISVLLRDRPRGPGRLDRNRRRQPGHDGAHLAITGRDRGQPEPT